MTGVRDVFATVQIVLAGGFLLWALQPASNGPSDLGLGLATVALGLSALVGLGLPQRSDRSALAQVGRLIAIGAFVVAAGFFLVALGLEMLI
jgi:hypothetical protein